MEETSRPAAALADGVEHSLSRLAYQPAWLALCPSSRGILDPRGGHARSLGRLVPVPLPHADGRIPPVNGLRLQRSYVSGRILRSSLDTNVPDGRFIHDWNGRLGTGSLSRPSALLRDQLGLTALKQSEQ